MSSPSESNSPSWPRAPRNPKAACTWPEHCEENAAGPCPWVIFADGQPFERAYRQCFDASSMMAPRSAHDLSLLSGVRCHESGTQERNERFSSRVLPPRRIHHENNRCVSLHLTERLSAERGSYGERLHQRRHCRRRRRPLCSPPWNPRRDRRLPLRASPCAPADRQTIFTCSLPLRARDLRTGASDTETASPARILRWRLTVRRPVESFPLAPDGGVECDPDERRRRAGPGRNGQRCAIALR